MGRTLRTSPLSGQGSDKSMLTFLTSCLPLKGSVMQNEARIMVWQNLPAQANH